MNTAARRTNKERGIHPCSTLDQNTERQCWSTSNLALVPGPGSAHGVFELPACMLDGGSNHVRDARST
jgi:hypothetical protein